MEHTTTVHGSAENALLLAQGWEVMAVYEDPRYCAPRSLMVRPDRAAVVAAENAGYARGYDTARRIYAMTAIRGPTNGDIEDAKRDALAEDAARDAARDELAR